MTRHSSKKLTSSSSHRSMHSPATSDQDTDSKCSPTTSHTEDHESHSASTPTHSISSHSAANHNSLSKTSVFERLYKSNIAAHQSYKNEQLNSQKEVENQQNTSLKKSMSNSTASLTTGTTTIAAAAAATTQTSSLSRRSNWTSRTRGAFSAGKSRVANTDEDTSKNDDEQSSSSS